LIWAALLALKNNLLMFNFDQMLFNKKEKKNESYIQVWALDTYVSAVCVGHNYRR